MKTTGEEFLDKVEKLCDEYGFCILIEVWKKNEDGEQFMLVRNADNTITLRNNFRSVVIDKMMSALD